MINCPDDFSKNMLQEKWQRFYVWKWLYVIALSNKNTMQITHAILDFLDCIIFNFLKPPNKNRKKEMRLV